MFVFDSALVLRTLHPYMLHMTYAYDNSSQQFVWLVVVNCSRFCVFVSCFCCDLFGCGSFCVVLVVQLEVRSRGSSFTPATVA